MPHQKERAALEGRPDNNNVSNEKIQDEAGGTPDADWEEAPTSRLQAHLATTNTTPEERADQQVEAAQERQKYESEFLARSSEPTRRMMADNRRIADAAGGNYGAVVTRRFEIQARRRRWKRPRLPFRRGSGRPGRRSQRRSAVSRRGPPPSDPDLPSGFTFSAAHDRRASEQLLADRNAEWHDVRAKLARIDLEDDLAEMGGSR